MSNERAPDGQVYVCGACGKTSRWKWGIVGNTNREPTVHDASDGWDESCSMHSVLVTEASIVNPVPWTYPMRVFAALTSPTVISLISCPEWLSDEEWAARGPDPRGAYGKMP